MVGWEHGGDGVDPDLVAFAKGVTSGYVPLGGVGISDEVAATFAERAYPGGLTYSGHPLACAAAVATIGVMDDEDVVEGADRIGARGDPAGPRRPRGPARGGRRGARRSAKSMSFRPVAA